MSTVLGLLCDSVFTVFAEYSHIFSRMFISLHTVQLNTFIFKQIFLAYTWSILVLRLQVRGDRGLMAIKGYSTLLRYPELYPHYLIPSGYITRTLLLLWGIYSWRILSLMRGWNVLDKRNKKICSLFLLDTTVVDNMYL